MEDVYFSILITILCLLGYGGAYYQYIKHKHYRISLFLIIFCGLILRMYVASDGYLHEWDERYHALVAKNLIQDPLTPTLYKKPILSYDYKDWSANHIWVHKQPFSLWLMAASISVFGASEWAVRLPSIFLSTLGIWLTFQITYYFFSKKVAFISAFLYSIHGLIIELTAGRVTTDHIDVSFSFFILLAIYFSILFLKKQRWYMSSLIGISIGLAILSKWLPALIVLPIWFCLCLNENIRISEITKHLLVISGTTVLVFLPWQLYIFSKFPLEAAWESHYNFLHLTHGLEGHSHPFYFHFDQMRIIYGELIYFPLLWFFYKSIPSRKKINWQRIALCIWVIIPFLFFSIAQTKMQAYTLFTAPALFIITALFWTFLFKMKAYFKSKTLVNLVLFLLLFLPIRYSVERTKLFQTKERNPLWVAETKALNHQIKEDNVVLFNVKRPIETMFYTDFIAYSKTPDKAIRDSLKINKYHLYSISENSDGEISFVKL